MQTEVGSCNQQIPGKNWLNSSLVPCLLQNLNFSYKYGIVAWPFITLSYLNEHDPKVAETKQTNTMRCTN